VGAREALHRGGVEAVRPLVKGRLGSRLRPHGPGLVAVVEAVPDAPDGQQVHRPGRLCFDLGSQSTDVDGHRLESTEVVGVSRGLVVDAYAQLGSAGFLRSTPGAGTTVAFLPASAPPDHWRGEHPVTRQPPVLDLRPGWPDLSSFPRREWAKATKAVMSNLPSSELGYV